MSKPYSDAKKFEVVTTWLALGKVPLVEAVTGVPRDTIKQWKYQPWWAEMVNEIQSECAQELDAKLTKIINKSLDATNERIEGGEFVIDSKTGQVKRVPVRLRDVSNVAINLLDKRDLLRDKPEKQKQAELQTDILTKLADTFAVWAKANIRGAVSAVHDKREEGLREGVCEVPQPEETDKEPKPAEPSPL